MRKYAVILAGGVGKRAGGSYPKQFVEISRLPMLFHSIRAFAEYDKDIKLIVVMNEDWAEEVMRLLIKHEFKFGFEMVFGGKTRVESSFNGLRAAMTHARRQGVSGAEEAIVAIHDAARPLVSASLIARGFEAVKPNSGAVPVICAVNSLRKLSSPFNESTLSQAKSVSVNRDEYIEVQTPQIFYLKDIFKATDDALSHPQDFTDDASVAENAGMDIILYEGDPYNLKVTNPFDFDIAEVLIKDLNSKLIQI